MPIKVNGLTTGSVTLAAPDTGSDVTMTLPGSSLDLSAELASKLPIAGGKILQIVRATDSTTRITTSTSLVDASISVTITPQKNDSAILVIWSFGASHQSTSDYARYQITDNSNNALSGAENGFFGSSTTSDLFALQMLIGYSTPSTTNSTTYKGRFSVFASGTARVENASITGQMYAIEVSA